jgi:hypothetical protein
VLRDAYRQLLHLATKLHTLERDPDPAYAKRDYMLHQLSIPSEVVSKFSSNTIMSLGYGDLNTITPILRDAGVLHLAKSSHFKMDPKYVRRIVVPMLEKIKRGNRR